MKRILGFLLTAIIVISMMPVTAVAGGNTFKAVYNTTNGANVLTFYYDYVDHSAEGVVYNLLPPAATDDSDWGYDSIRANVKSVVIDESVKNYTGLTSTAYMFYGMKKAENISGAENLDVSNVTKMSYMFAHFGELVEGFNVVPDVSGWNTSKVTSTMYMFFRYGWKSDVFDKVPNVSNWNTENLETASNMFKEYGNYSKRINVVPDVSNWETQNLQYAEAMFFYFGVCSTEMNVAPDVSGWNTEKLCNIKEMFSRFGKSSTKLNAVPNVSNWNTTKITSLGDFMAYYGMESNELEFVVDLSDWKLSAYAYDNSLFNSDTAKNAKKWIVKIPGKIGEEPNIRVNTTTSWNVGDSKVIAPPSGRVYSLLKTITNEVPIGAKNTKNGYIDVSSESWSGENVTMTVAPNEDYTLKDNSLKALYNDGEDKSCTLTQDATDKTKYTFTMPAYEVTVQAEFVPIPKAGDEFEVDGITYKVTSLGTTNTVEVTPNYYLFDKVTIPEKVSKDSIEFTVTSIGNGAFNGDTNLLEITLPDSITNIGKNAFNECCLLPSITIPSGVTSIGEWAFYQCDALKEISLPDNIASIGEYTFCGCDNLENVELPNNLTSIGDYAFYDCGSLVNITIPQNVNTIGEKAFYRDTNLATINMLGTVPPTIDYDVFSDVTSIIVPKTALAAYKEASIWNEYGYLDKAFFDVDVASLTNGTITIDENAFSSETVTLKVVPADNYQLKADSLKVIYNTDKSIVPTAAQTEGEYTFIMPEYDVTITAEFEEMTSGIKFTASSDKDTYLEGERITLTATVLDGNTPVDNEFVVFSANGRKYTLTTINGSCSISISLPAGSYIISACYEKDGDEYKDEVEVTVKEQPNENHIVKFDLNNGKTDGPAPQEIKHGEKATKPADPSDEGWIFEGWYSDAELTTEYDFNTPIMADTTVFAKWTEEGLPTPPEPEPKPVEVYYAPLVADLKANEDGVIEWKAGDSLPLEAVKLLVDKPELSLEFTFTYEGEEHTIYIPAGAFEKYYDVTIPWYGPAWLIQYFEKAEKDVIEYTIVKDDTLNALAEKYKCTVEEILVLNPYVTNPNKIYPNNKLLIPVQK